MSEVLETRWTKALGGKVTLRTGTSDHQTWIDTFEDQFAVPPAGIEPDVVLDLGANVGLTAAHYEVMWPKAQVVAVEMDAENARICGMNFHGTIINVAVGAYTGTASYHRDTWQARHSLTRPGEVMTPVLALDELIDRYLEPGDIFCKMDIEGTEWTLLGNLNERIKWLLVELHGDLPAEEMIDEATELLAFEFVVVPHRVHPHALWAVR